MGGGVFDSMWDTYPRMQPRSRFYNRPRAPVSDPYGASRVPSKGEEPPSKTKTMRVIPVSDGGAVQADVRPVVAKLDGEVAAAAATIQAVYRGYLVRKTQPLKQLGVIKEVKGELADFKQKLLEEGQERKLRSDSQERLRWTEGVMALLLRLDTLQGVHPDVRIIRKAVTKELIQFQEEIDSMSTVPGRDGVIIDKYVDQVFSDMHGQIVDSHVDSNFHGDERGPLSEIIVEEVGFVSEPISRNVDAEVPMGVEEEQILATVPATEEVKVESATSQIEHLAADADRDKNYEALGVENSAAAEPSRYVISQPFSEDGAPAAPANENDVEEMWEQAHHMWRTEDGAAVAPANENDVEEMWEQAHHMWRTEDGAAVAPANESHVEETWDHDHHMWRRDESDRLTDEPGISVLNMPHNSVLGSNSETTTAHLEEKETTSGFTDQADEWMVPAGCTSRSTCLEPQCIDSLQVSQPSTTDDMNALTGRALLLQLVEENRKLKDVVGKVLHWEKHKNDVIHNLTARIKQLEEHRPQLNSLKDEEIKGRKTESDDELGDRGRFLQSKRECEKRSERDNCTSSEDWTSSESEAHF